MYTSPRIGSQLLREKFCPPLWATCGCYNKLRRENIFDHFWGIGDYSPENSFLSKLLKNKIHTMPL